MEKDFFQALASLKTKDPSIYDEGKKFFDGKELVRPKKSQKEQTMFLRDYERKMVLEKGGNLSDDEANAGPSGVISYHEEQQTLKQDLRKVIANADSDEELLTVRKKSEQEKVSLVKRYGLYRVTFHMDTKLVCRKKTMMNTKNGLKASEII